MFDVLQRTFLTFHSSGISTRRTVVMVASEVIPLSLRLAPSFTLLPL